MQIIRDSNEMQATALAHKRAGRRIGFVPTMGFLHAGHVSLMALARPRCDVLVASIYVNPSQFGPNEDLARYPRDEAGDLDKCAAVGCDVVFLPETTDMYPSSHQTWVTLEALPSHLCGASRPNHFRGVATIVAKLFGLVQPDLAVFGEKDWQQLAVIRRMTRDLAMPVEILGGPIVREPDGLAMSSRNAYLSTEERTRARSLSDALGLAARRVQAGQTGADVLLRAIDARLAMRLDAAIDRVDYVAIVHPNTLEAVTEVSQGALAALAVFVGRTRLIDNRLLVPLF